MDGPEILIPLAFFAFLTAVIVIPIWLREKTKQSAHGLIKQAIERGEKVDPDLITRLSEAPAKKQDRPRQTLGNAVIMIALAIGLTAATYFGDGGFHGFDGKMIAAAILGALGFGFLVLAIVDYNTKTNSEG